MLHNFTVINVYIIGTTQQSVVYCYKLMNIKTKYQTNLYLTL